jgi:bifunctional non-homologous end joining protein LigD
MALEQYRAKRNFTATPEPKPKVAKKSERGHSFVIQKHAARRLHYDFRLELDGVLKSWAVTRGPSLDPGEKRLAVEVEDHPLEYGSFEGTIPKGEYGGGAVMVWDRGKWSPIGDPHKGLAKGHLEFTLAGQKLRGRWHLVRMHRRPREKHDNWLLIKGEDDYAEPAGGADILEVQPDSAATGRSIEDIASDAPGWSSKTGRIERPKGERPAPAKPDPPKPARRKKKAPDAEPHSAAPRLDPASITGARKAPLPDFVEPMLASLADASPEGERWVHEIKFDGYRLEAHRAEGRVRLLTRSGLDWTGKFGASVSEAFRALPVRDALIDGEIVVENESGASAFSLLQADLSEGRTDRFRFYAFDLIHLDGWDLREATLVDRKGLLAQLIGEEARGTLRFSGHLDESGAVVFAHACRLGLEGVVSKLRESPYRSGRGMSWIKSKCSARQEFVIGGFVPSTATSNAIGSLSLGVYESGALRYVGRVGTGFSATTAKSLYKTLEPMRMASSPFSRKLTADEARNLRYVRPELVAEVDFRAWTADQILRHASFQGLRDDKSAKEVVREAGPAEAPRKAAPKEARVSVTLTHPDRIYWPEQGVTKQGLADYYAEVWPRIAPFIVGRALALLRCPDGIHGQQFFQKHGWKGLNKNVVLVTDPREPDESLISIRDLDGLIGLVQAGVLEIHPWGSTIGDWERPDTIIMDLDPGENVRWEAVIEAATEVQARLEAAGLAAFVKTSGGKGLHVVAPVKPDADWPAVKAFTKAIADSMAADSPDRYVATIAKAKRTGKILIDYLRNQRGMTAVAAYSTRARPGAAVSMPLAWEELTSGVGPAYFTLLNAPARLAALARDPWEGFRSAAAPIGAAKAKRVSKARKSAKSLTRS